MLSTLTMAQSVSPEVALQSVGIPALVIGLLIGAAISGLIVGLLLKFVGGSVLGYPVKYGSAFLAIFVVVLIQGAVGFAMLFGGLVDMGAMRVGGGIIDQLMPFGPVVFLVSQAIGLAIMTWAVRTFLKGPSDEAPSWSNALMIAAIMIVILIAFSLLMAQIAPQPGA